MLLFTCLEVRYTENMTIRFAYADEVAGWDGCIIRNPDRGSVFQSREFADIKRLGGWRALYIVADTVYLTVLEKTVPFLGKLWYIPKGPGVETTRQLDELIPELRILAESQGVFVIKIEPELIKSPEVMADCLKMGLVAVRPIQSNFSTVLLDLSPDLGLIMARLNQKGRHAIRRAERDGVTVQRIKSTDENCRVMYDLLAATAAGSFGIRSYRYYQAFWQTFEEAEMGQLFFAYSGGQLVAGAYVLIMGTKSTYKDGASLRERPVYGASHLLQWNVIQWAKEKGAVQHDLCGSPPSDQIHDAAHAHYGIGRFKTSFNKQVTDYVGAFDIVVDPGKYKWWSSVGERAAMRIHAARYHESYY